MGFLPKGRGCGKPGAWASVAETFCIGLVALRWSWFIEFWLNFFACTIECRFKPCDTTITPYYNWVVHNISAKPSFRRMLDFWCEQTFDVFWISTSIRFHFNVYILLLHSVPIEISHIFFFVRPIEIVHMNLWKTFFSFFFLYHFWAPQSTTQFQLFFLLLSYFTNYTLKLVLNSNDLFLWDSIIYSTKIKLDRIGNANENLYTPGST